MDKAQALTLKSGDRVRLETGLVGVIIEIYPEGIGGGAFAKVAWDGMDPAWVIYHDLKDANIIE